MKIRSSWTHNVIVGMQPHKSQLAQCSSWTSTMRSAHFFRTARTHARAWYVPASTLQQRECRSTRARRSAHARALAYGDAQAYSRTHARAISQAETRTEATSMGVRAHTPTRETRTRTPARARARARAPLAFRYDSKPLSSTGGLLPPFESFSRGRVALDFAWATGESAQPSSSKWRPHTHHRHQHCLPQHRPSLAV
eukprot:6210239-Pleurochrysis_carterae.AAC.1